MMQALNGSLENTEPVRLPVFVDQDYGQFRSALRVSPGEDFAQSLGQQELTASHPSARSALRLDELKLRSAPRVDNLKGAANENVRGAELLIRQDIAYTNPVAAAARLAGALAVQRNPQHVRQLAGVPPIPPESQMPPSECSYSSYARRQFSVLSSIVSTRTSPLVRSRESKRTSRG